MWNNDVEGAEDLTGMDGDDTRCRSLQFIHAGHVYDP
jgi:hypothetical protein